MVRWRGEALMIRGVAWAATCLLYGSATSQTLEGLECHSTAQQGEVLLVFSGMPTPRILELTSPPRLVLDLVGMRKTPHVGDRELAQGPVERVRIAQFAERPVPIMRVVADLRRSCLYELQWVEGGLVLLLKDYTTDASEPVESQDILQRFRAVYHRDRDRERAMALLFEGIREDKIRFDDTEGVKAVLDDVAEYYAIHHRDDEQFTDLVLSMLDEGRIRPIVDQFHDKALRVRGVEGGAPRSAPPPATTAREPGAGSQATESTADRFWNLYVLAVEAERQWRTPAALTINDLPSRGQEWKPLTYSITGMNRVGRLVTLPTNLIVQVIPPNAARHDAEARTLVPMRVGSFVLRARTADGTLQVEKQVLVQPPALPEVPMASLIPRRGILEIDERAEFTISANNALQRQGWRVEWEPQDILGGLKNYEDSCKAVITIHARQSGVGRLLVTGDGKELSEATLYVLPPAPSKIAPMTLTLATAGAVAGALAAAEDGNADVKVWLGYGAVPALALSAVINWWRYREQGATRERFLREQPTFEGTPPVAARATIPRDSP